MYTSETHPKFDGYYSPFELSGRLGKIGANENSSDSVVKPDPELKESSPSSNDYVGSLPFLQEAKRGERAASSIDKMMSTPVKVCLF